MKLNGCDKLDFGILTLLVCNRKAVSFATGITLQDVAETTKVPLRTLRRRIYNLTSLNLIAKGIKDRKAATYYATAEGKNFLIEGANK
ncbi:MAG: hypothetical protein FWG65_05395 [Turicibacter sp.]|nr:hypothetical protein [Turicibacter sp.]